MFTMIEKYTLLIIIGIAIIDRLIGSPLYLMFLDAINLKGYPSLYSRYHDRAGEDIDWMFDNYNYVVSDAMKRGDYKIALQLKHLHFNNDWDSLLELMLEYEKVENLY